MDTIQQPSEIIVKPRYGSPCNHCGLCCSREVCGIGKMVHGDDVAAPCPSLVRMDGKYLCEVVLVEKVAGLKPEVAAALGIGKGCCADDLATTPAQQKEE